MNISSPAARRAVTVAALTCGGAFAAALLAACGSQASNSPSASGTTPPSPSATPHSTPPSASLSPSSTPTVHTEPRIPAHQCPTSALRARVNKTKGGAAAGTSYVALDFTNISSHSCDLFGFPGVSFRTGNPGSVIGAPASRQTTFGPETVSLASGATAHAWLGLVDVGNFSPSACGPVTAHWLKIYPPDQFTALYTEFTAQVCSKKVTTSTPLLILPIRPGAGTAGRVP
ncbi:MAG: DUF4232 domain-containing protein [Kitasatospora sp.]|jgi:hypothetical protein|nr:DUF4232 domain-containing protein [Kitasatospora sp.]